MMTTDGGVYQAGLVHRLSLLILQAYLSFMVSLVTGGAGFIGSHLVSALLAGGHRVVVLDDLSGGFPKNVPPAADFINGSVTDNTLLESLFQQYRFDYVYHLAAYAAEGLSHFIRRFNYTGNLLGSVNLINQSILHKVKCFVFTSSIAVYGNGEPPMLESNLPVPADPYGIAKYAVELDLQAAHELFGLNYVIFRPHNVYGEKQNIGDRYRNVIGIFMNQLMQHQPLTIFGDGTQTRAFSYIGDVIPYLADCVRMPAALNQVFNVGGDQQYSLKDLAQMVRAVSGRQQPVQYLPARQEAIHAYADHSKIKSVFNIPPGEATDLQSGIRKMWEWAVQTGPRKSKAFENIEIMENLPEIWKPEGL